MKNYNPKVRIVILVFCILFLTSILINGSRAKFISLRGFNIGTIDRIPFFNINLNEDTSEVSNIRLNEQNQYSASLENIKTINLDLTIDRVILKSSEENNINIIEKSNYKLKDSEKLRINEKGSTLDIIRNDKNFMAPFKDINRELEIYLPNEYKENLIIKNNVGDILIQNELTLKSLTINQDVGEFRLKENLIAESFDFQSETGSLDSKSIEVSSYDIKTNVGSIDIKDLRGKGELKSDIGEIQCVINDIKGNIDIQTDTGEINAYINTEIDFNLKIKNDIGDVETDIQLNNYRNSKDSIEGSVGNNPTNTINIESDIGDIGVYSK